MIYGDCNSCSCTYASGCKYEQRLKEKAAQCRSPHDSKGILDPSVTPKAQRQRGSSAGTGFRQKMRAYKAAQEANIA